jgi:multiple sugar transport system permease protein
VKRQLQSLALHAAILAIAAAVVAPIAWMAVAAFMPAGQAQKAPPVLWPQPWTLDHFRQLFSRLNLGRCFLNSLFVATAITACSLVLNGMAGYAFAKLRFSGRDKIFRGLMTALVAPLQVGMLPLFLMLKQIGAINTYWAVILPSMASIYGMFMVRQYALSVPDSLLDSARIDGAGELRIFFLIVVPLIRPVLATLAIFTFLSAWNDFMWPLIVLTDGETYTLPVALAILSTEHVQEAELMMAGTLVTLLPALGVFAVLQKQLIVGIMGGAVRE